MAIDFTGIYNENEFYTHHYLAAILEKDLKDVLNKWKQQDKGSEKNNLAFLHPDFTISLIDLQSQKSSK